MRERGEGSEQRAVLAVSEKATAGGDTEPILVLARLVRSGAAKEQLRALRCVEESNRVTRKQPVERERA